MKISIVLLKRSRRKLLLLILSILGREVARKSMLSLLLYVRIYLNAFLRCVVYSFVGLSLPQRRLVMVLYRIVWSLLIEIVALVVSRRTGIKVWVLYEYFLAVDDFSVIRLRIIIDGIQTVVIQAVLMGVTLVSARYNVQVTGCLENAWETGLLKGFEVGILGATGRLLVWGLIDECVSVFVDDRVHAIMLIGVVLLKSDLSLMRVHQLFPLVIHIVFIVFELVQEFLDPRFGLTYFCRLICGELRRIMNWDFTFFVYLVWAENHSRRIKPRVFDKLGGKAFIPMFGR